MFNVEVSEGLVSKLADRPIPTEVSSVAGWKEIPLAEPENPESLVPLGSFSKYDSIFTSSVYFGQHNNSPYMKKFLEGSMPTIFVREGVAEALKVAEKQLPKGMYFVVYDAYRPLQVQQSLYDTFYGELKNQHSDWSENQLSVETQKFVSLPRSPKLDPDVKFVSPHNTGGAVDLAISVLSGEDQRMVDQIDQELSGLDQENDLKAYKLQFKKYQILRQKGTPLDFGTLFDHGGSRAALNYYEVLAKQRPLTSEEKKAQENRRILYNAMIDVGFQPYEDEWWHYNSLKTQMGAKTAGLDHAEYGSADLSEENLKFDEMIRMHEFGVISMEQGSAVGVSKPELEKEFKVVARSVMEARKTGGSVLKTSQLESEIIRPAA